jgi:hypothetical protein
MEREISEAKPWPVCQLNWGVLCRRCGRNPSEWRGSDGNALFTQIHTYPIIGIVTIGNRSVNSSRRSKVLSVNVMMMLRFWYFSRSATCSCRVVKFHRIGVRCCKISTKKNRAS